MGGADARGLLHALLDGADLERIEGSEAVLTLRVPRRLLDALCEWEADAEDDGIDEGAGW